MEHLAPGDGNGSSAAVARQRIEMAMLELSGERGYAAVTLELLLDRAGVERAEFHAHFADLDGCFTAAYRAEAEALCEAMLAEARREAGWREATGAALLVALRFASARPDIARALVREVHVVGGPALAKREEMLERLAHAMGDGCQEPPPDLSVPRAPSFIVGAVEGVIAGHLDRGEAQELLASAPELLDLIAIFFLGRDA